MTQDNDLIAAKARVEVALSLIDLSDPPLNSVHLDNGVTILFSDLRLVLAALEDDGVRGDALTEADHIANLLARSRRDNGYVIATIAELDGYLEAFLRARQPAP
jgi:hypothetical protein